MAATGPALALRWKHRDNVQRRRLLDWKMHCGGFQMKHLLVVPLILGLLSCGQSKNKTTNAKGSWPTSATIDIVKPKPTTAKLDIQICELNQGPSLAQPLEANCRWEPLDNVAITHEDATSRQWTGVYTEKRAGEVAAWARFTPPSTEDEHQRGMAAKSFLPVMLTLADTATITWTRNYPKPGDEVSPKDGVERVLVPARTKAKDTKIG